MFELDLSYINKSYALETKTAVLPSVTQTRMAYSSFFPRQTPLGPVSSETRSKHSP